MPITLPHTFHDNVSETASGVQVDDNFNTLKAAIEELQSGLFSGGFGSLYVAGHQLQFKALYQSALVGAPTAYFTSGPVIEWPTVCAYAWLGSAVSFNEADTTGVFVPFNASASIINGAGGSKANNAAAISFQSPNSGFRIHATVFGLGY